MTCLCYRVAILLLLLLSPMTISAAPKAASLAPAAKTSFFPTKLTSTPDPAYVWSSLFAGIGSGALASIVCAPLDVMRTRMQVWGDIHNTKTTWSGFVKQIWKNEGHRGFFRGLGASLATVPLFWGLYFPMYEDMKERLAAEGRHPALVHCGSAIIAGGIADVICNPMFVVRLRLTTMALHAGQPHAPEPGILKTIGILYKEGGIPIFWRGLAASLVGLSHVAVQFPVYEWLKEQARERNGSDQLRPVDLLVTSGLSKMSASLLTYPHEVVRSRMMDSRVSSQAYLWATIMRIWKKEGLQGFYSGLHISLLRVVPNCCVTFMTYELLLQFAKEKMLEQRRKQS